MRAPIPKQQMILTYILATITTSLLLFKSLHATIVSQDHQGPGFTTSLPGGELSFVFQRCLFECERVNCTLLATATRSVANQSSARSRDSDSVDNVSVYSSRTVAAVSSPRLKKQQQRRGYNLLEAQFSRLETGSLWNPLPWGWECEDECRYTCMWHAVEAYSQDGQSLPHFYSKWPFVRLFGLRQPMSVIFSIIIVILYLNALCKFIQTFPGSRNIIVKAWTLYYLISLTLWSFAVIYYTNQTSIIYNITTIFSTIQPVYSLLTLLLRFFHNRSKEVNFVPLMVLTQGNVAIGPLLYIAFVDYSEYFTLESFKSATSICASIGWMVWSASQRDTNPASAQTCILAVTLSNIIGILDYCHFPPWLWLFDAVATKVLASTTIPLLWSAFIFADCEHVLSTQSVAKN